jgi:hypothetical protein
MDELFRKFMNDLCSPEEIKTLLAHFNLRRREERLRKLIFENLETIDNYEDERKWKPVIDKILISIKNQIFKVIPTPSQL